MAIGFQWNAFGYFFYLFPIVSVWPWPWNVLEMTLSCYATGLVLCANLVGDSLKQKLDSFSDTVTDNVRGTGTVLTVRDCLTLWHPLLPYRYSYKASCARLGWAVICNFWHLGTVTLRAERQSAQMSKITNDGLTRSGTACFIAVPIWQRCMGRVKVWPFVYSHSIEWVLLFIFAQLNFMCTLCLKKRPNFETV